MFQVWRPVRESNPCRRREREENYCNSRKPCGMDSTLLHLTDSRERLLDSWWTRVAGKGAKERYAPVQLLRQCWATHRHPAVYLTLLSSTTSRLSVPRVIAKRSPSGDKVKSSNRCDLKFVIGCGGVPSSGNDQMLPTSPTVLT